MKKAVIRLTKQFTFEAAHALEGYDGKCKHIHGHSYILYITVSGVPCDDYSHPKLGMVMDFGELKRITEEQVISRFDHCLILRTGAPVSAILQAQYGRVEIVDFQPTCENMLPFFAQLIQTQLPGGVSLHSLKLHETATSFAEWYQSDNQ